MANTLAYYDTATITAVKSFIAQAPVLKFVNYGLKRFLTLVTGAHPIKSQLTHSLRKLDHFRTAEKIVFNYEMSYKSYKFKQIYSKKVS